MGNVCVLRRQARFSAACASAKTDAYTRIIVCILESYLKCMHAWCGIEMRQCVFGRCTYVGMYCICKPEWGGVRGHACLPFGNAHAHRLSSVHRRHHTAHWASRGSNSSSSSIAPSSRTNQKKSALSFGMFALLGGTGADPIKKMSSADAGRAGAQKTNCIYVQHG